MLGSSCQACGHCHRLHIPHDSPFLVGYRHAPKRYTLWIHANGVGDLEPASCPAVGFYGAASCAEVLTSCAIVGHQAAAVDSRKDKRLMLVSSRRRCPHSPEQGLYADTSALDELVRALPLGILQENLKKSCRKEQAPPMPLYGPSVLSIASRPVPLPQTPLSTEPTSLKFSLCVASHRYLCVGRRGRPLLQPTRRA
jgi:hypothetical protein